MKESNMVSRRRYLGTLARAVSCGYAAAILGPTIYAEALEDKSQVAKSAVIPVHSVLINFQYEITACCAYYQGNGTYTQFPVKLEPEGKYMELFMTPPGEPEKSLSFVKGSEFLTDAHNAHWGGTFQRASNPFPQRGEGNLCCKASGLNLYVLDTDRKLQRLQPPCPHATNRRIICGPHKRRADTILARSFR